MGCTLNKAQNKDYSAYLQYFTKRSGQGKYFLKALEYENLKNGNKFFFTIRKDFSH